jgi:hypothetical protein
VSIKNELYVIGVYLIERYRKRSKYIEFDWKEGEAILKFLRYFPKFGKVYTPRAASEYKRGVYYYMYTLEPELNVKILNACKEKFHDL